MPVSKESKRIAARLRRKVAALRESGEVRYPKPLKMEIVACVARLRAEGVAWDQCREILGICKATIYTWHREAVVAQPGAAMVPVRVRTETGPSSGGSLALVTPNGLTLSGFDLAEAAQLLRVLG